MREFVSEIEKSINSSHIILSSDIQKYFGPNEESVYLKGRIIIINGSVLEIAIFAVQSVDVISVDKYRFHYMSNSGQMLFRYDNAPHHSEMTSYPHHKHAGDSIIQSEMPSLKDVLNEISATLLQGEIRNYIP